VPRALVLPVNGQDPPALAIIEELKTVNAAHERCRIARIVTRFVSAPNVSDSAKLFGAPRNFCFVKPSLQKWLRSRDVTFDVQQLRLKMDIVPSGHARGRNQTGAGIKQRPFAVPVALLSSRPGDHVVRGGDNRIDRFNVACYCFAFHIKDARTETRMSYLRHDE
jgi:hypothetical protein